MHTLRKRKISSATFECIDAHTCGNPVRVVVSGIPPLSGANMREKRQHFISHYDWIRQGLMFEPRGHDMMSGSILYPPHHSQNDAAILFIETSGCLPMCGHGTIGSITVAIEEGLIQPKVPGQVRLETPAGLVKVQYQENDGKVEWVHIINVPSYVAAQGLKVYSEFLGPLTMDVAYGGNFYAIIDPQENFKGLQPYSASELIQFSQQLRTTINKKYPDQFVHPEDEAIAGVSHILWTGKPLHEGSSGRNAVFYADKAIDRSPCGTGTSARMAQLYLKNQLGLQEDFIHESYIGSRFVGRIEKSTTVGPFEAIVPSIKGWAKVFGRSSLTIDQSDPYAYGFQVL